MLKMLALKMVKKYMNIYKYELILLGRDDTKQVKSLIFIAVPQVEQIPKVLKKKKQSKTKIRTYDNSNYKLT